MNILFLTLVNITSIEDHGIYEDLLREFIRNNHQVFVVSPAERKLQENTHIVQQRNTTILRVQTGNVQKTNLIEKGISTVLLETQFIKAIKKYYADTRFDLVLYSTPPVTLAKVIQYIKKRDGAKSYLLLKDIFPQNAVDLGMMSATGPKGLIYKYFRGKEKELYALSDYIGCMSPANAEYILNHNPEIPASKVEVCPNCVEVQDMRFTDEKRKELRQQYGLPQDKKIFVYGGNLGKPQDVPFIVKCLKKCAALANAYFVIAGSGTDRHFLEKYIKDEQPSHVKLFEQLPKNEYDKMAACCDVGLIFLDHRFTIPNFPSRLLAYMQAGLPVLACTDSNTDIGKIISENKFGWWCESNNFAAFGEVVEKILSDEYDDQEKGNKAWEYLLEKYTVEREYTIIEKSIEMIESELELQEIKRVTFKILQHFRSFCEEHHLRYYLSNGTLLGAVKYKGFIPWDDDIDVLIPREDYNRLLELYQNNKQYRLFSIEREPNYRFPFAKLCDMTTVKKEINIDNGVPLGLDIDIFPLDNCSDHILRSSVQRNLKKCQIGCNLSKFETSRGRPFYKRCIIDYCRFRGYDHFYHKLFALIGKERAMGQTYKGCLMWPIYGKREIIPAEVFSATIEVEFEGEKFPAPIGYDTYLRSLYGEYEKDPPKEKQQTHHSFKAFCLEGVEGQRRIDDIL